MCMPEGVRGLCEVKVSRGSNNWTGSIQDPCPEFLGTGLYVSGASWEGDYNEQEGRVQSHFSSELGGEESSHLRWGFPGAEEVYRG